MVRYAEGAGKQRPYLKTPEVGFKSARCQRNIVVVKIGGTLLISYSDFFTKQPEKD